MQTMVMMFKFIHAADLHIDSPLRGLERYEGAPTEQLRGATRGALENLVDLALEEEVAFVLLAGDLYDGDWRDYNTGLFFIKQLARLREGGVQAFIVYGNHDAQSKMTRSLSLPDNAHAFRTTRPETRVVAGHEVAIHGQGFGSASVAEDLTTAYPAPRRDCFNIGRLHNEAAVHGASGEGEHVISRCVSRRACAPHTATRHQKISDQPHPPRARLAGCTMGR